jgi:hypothetical protein
MSSETKKAEKHTFSIELKSKEYLKLVAMPNGARDDVLLEGFLGDLEVIDLVEGAMLEIQGTNGSFKMDLTAEELTRLCNRIARK